MSLEHKTLRRRDTYCPFVTDGDTEAEEADAEAEGEGMRRLEEVSRTTGLSNLQGSGKKIQMRVYAPPVKGLEKSNTMQSLQGPEAKMCNKIR